MRRKIASSLLLLVFFSIQYAKVLNYFYCKYQAEIVQQLKDCGCENHLAGVFADKGSQASPSITLKEVAFEYAEQHQIEITAPLLIATNIYGELVNFLPSTVRLTPDRPPIA